VKTTYVADVLLFVALALVVAGVAMLSIPVAFIVAGVGIAAMAIWIGRTSR
jgi:hypothetical protein